MILIQSISRYAFVYFVVIHSSFATESVNQQSDCPSHFYGIPLTESKKQCQQFAEQLPATLTYHSPHKPEKIDAWYQQQLGKPESKKQVKGRLLLEYRTGNQILIFSEDGNGTQIDMLIIDSINPAD
jgi:hypothetical protein